MVVPLRMRGLIRSAMFERNGDHLVSRGYHLCGFVPMQGAGAHGERLVPIDGDEVGLRVDGQQPVGADRLRDALFAPRVQRWSGVELGGVEPIDNLDLWLATAVDNFGLLTATKDAIDSGRVDPGCGTSPGAGHRQETHASRHFLARTAGTLTKNENSRHQHHHPRRNL